MKRFALAGVAMMAVLAAPVAAQDRRDGQRGGSGRPYANPSAVIAAEIAFSQLAQKGQWTAFRDTAAPEADMFVPQRVNAHTWLKGRADPPVSVRWQPHEVWMSCDGAAAVTRGGWEGPGGTGYFTTVWQRQPKRGDYKWLLDQGDTLTQPLSAPDMITAKVADCPPRSRTTDRAVQTPKRDAGTAPVQRPLPAPMPASAAESGADAKDGRSRDGSLVWRSTVQPDGARRLTVWIWLDSGWSEILDSRVGAAAG